MNTRLNKYALENALQEMTSDLNIVKVWVDAAHVYAETADGLRASYAFSDWERLAHATDDQRRDFYLSPAGIHWPQIDEDLSFEGMFRDNGYPAFQTS